MSSKALATWSEKSVHWKKPWCWERLRVRGEGVAEDEMVGWHHWLNGHEFKQTRGDSEGPGSLACCSSCGCRELDMTWCPNKNTGLWNILDELMLIKWYCWLINILLLFCYSCGKRCSKFQVFKFLCVNFIYLHALSYYPSTKEKVTLKIKFHQWQ